MTVKATYIKAAQAYSEGVRALLEPVTFPSTERGLHASTSYKQLATQANQLAPLSAKLTVATAAQFTEDDPAVRIMAANQLLAKALTDLEIGAYLLQSAQEEETNQAQPQAVAPHRGILFMPEVENNLAILIEAREAGPLIRERGAENLVSLDLPAAHDKLNQTIGYTLDLIRMRAAKTSQAAIGGLLPLGLGEITQAAGMVGLDIAQVLGQAEKINRLYNLFRTFILNTYNSLIALLGPTLVRAAVNQAVAWTNDLTQGEKFAELLERLYQTAETKQMLNQCVQESQAGLEKFLTTIQDVDSLNSAYLKQITLVEKLLTGLRLLSSLPAAVLPQGKLLMATTYLLLTSFVILSGADFVDAPRLKMLDRVPGTRQIVEKNLLSP